MSSGDGGPNDADITTQGCVSTPRCVSEHLDEPYACLRKGEPCVALKTKECPVVFGDFRKDGAVYLGAFLNLPATAPLSQMSALNVRLAIDGIDGSMGGLPGGALGKIRPLVTVGCRNDPTLVSTAAKHLFDQVRVPAVLAHLPSAELKKLFVDEARPRSTSGPRTWPTASARSPPAAAFA
jgi:hypothetical protein